MMLENMTAAEVFNKVKSGEWTSEQFDKYIDYMFDTKYQDGYNKGYDEGYNHAQEY